MLNQFSRLKNGLIGLCMVLALLYALPNIFGEVPALQISSELSEALDSGAIQKIETVLKEHDLAYQLEPGARQMTIRFQASADQLEAQALIATLLGEDYIVALNMAANTPIWMQHLGAKPMKLGLDLRGGVHFLLQVDLKDVMQRHWQGLEHTIADVLKENELAYQRIRMMTDAVNIAFANAQDKNQARKALETIPGILIQEQNEAELIALQIVFTPAEQNRWIDETMAQSMATLRSRVNELGIAEAVVQRQGLDRIVVELPGVQDTAYAKKILGTTASLSFQLLSLDEEEKRFNTVVYRNAEGQSFRFDRTVVLSGENIVGAQSGFDEYGKPAVFIQVGGNTSYFSKMTADNIGRQMGTILIQTRYHDVPGQSAETQRIAQTDYQVISLATIQSRLGNRFQITNMGSAQAARDLALLLRAGALPAPVDMIEERIIGPSMGLENIKKGVLSLVVGLALVLSFMVIYYGAFGWVANFALLGNLVLLVAILSLLNATLTLPSMAAIVLTLGMAVDANVLIFERIREELRLGQSGHASIHAGYEKAFVTILDANITTFIAGAALFAIGSGPIKGFATTLILGLATSVFTAVTLSRAIVNLVWGGKRLKTLPIGIKNEKR